MFDFIEGEIVSKEAQKLVLKTGGLGYALKVSNQTLSALPPMGSTVLVFANLQVREDDVSLYGFSTKEERMFFDLLIQITGVGPKLALTILSAYPLPTLRKALVTGDLAVLSSISGIGKKTAQRLVLELRDKLGKDFLSGDETTGFGAIADGSLREEVDQAVAALEALGYTRAEIMKGIGGVDLSQLDVEAIIKLGLKKIARY